MNVPQIRSSNDFRLSEFNLGNIQNIDKFALQGLTIKFDYNAAAPCSVAGKIITGNDKTGLRTVSLKEGGGTAEIGGVFDLFGLKYDDYKEFGRIQIDLNIMNPYQNDVYVDISNIRVEVNYIILDGTDWKRFWINGESNEYYQCFLKNMVIYGGPNNEVEIFNVEGNDIHVAYRQNIVPKEIELEFDIDACNFNDGSLLLQRAARWFANNRTKYNRPIPNTIEFEQFPDRVFDYVMEDSIEEEITEGGTYECKVKLLVPSGTMRTKEPVITNSTGVNSGVAKVLPKLQILATSKEISLTETVSRQNFSIRPFIGPDNVGIEEGDIVILNSETRKATKLHKIGENNYNSVDITRFIDFDSEWFVFNPGNEFNISGNGSCIVQTVEFFERW